MKRFSFANSFTSFQKILLCICAAIIVATIFITAWAFTSTPERVGSGLRRVDPTPVRAEKKAGDGYSVYSEIGRLRAVTADIPAVPIVITPFFTYPTDDVEFFEELAQKKRQIRSIILEYFAQRSKDELIRYGENQVKNDLITLINNELALGQISVLYFNEYIFLN